MTIKDRIKILIKYFCNGKKSNFAQMIGVTPSVVGNITGKRNGNPSFEVIHKILSAYPEINPEWFIMGTGEMIKESLDKNQGCPFYQTDLSDLSELLINNKPILPNYYINYPPYNKKGIFWCQVIGRSMEPEISHNDVIALMPMSTSINILPQGEIYAIITDNYITVKLLF